MNKKIILALAIIAVTGVLLTTVLLSWLEKRTVATEQTEQAAIEQVKEQYESELMSLSGVVGVGVGECEVDPCIKVYLDKESRSLRRQIPTQLDGFKVDIEVTGPIRALPQQ